MINSDMNDYHYIIQQRKLLQDLSSFTSKKPSQAHLICLPLYLMTPFVRGFKAM